MIRSHLPAYFYGREAREIKTDVTLLAVRPGKMTPGRHCRSGERQMTADVMDMK